MTTVRLTSVDGPPGTPLGQWLAGPVHRRSSWPALVRPFDRIVAAVDADDPEDAAAAADAGAEAIAVRRRRAGAAVTWTAPRRLPSVPALLGLARRRGQESVAAVRAEPDLLPELELGAWTEAGWRTRVARRVLTRRAGAPAIRLLARGPAGAVGLAADCAFWAGVRRAAGRAEWRRWTASYVVLSYHRISADAKPGQELLEVSPRRFATQMRLLRLLGFRPLAPAEVAAIHHGDAAPPRRGFVVTADDGFLDCTEPLRRAAVHAQLFVPTADVGGRAAPSWYDDRPAAGWQVDDEPLAGWPRLREIEAAGVAIGGHGQRHAALPELAPDELHRQLAGSRADLARELTAPIAAMAYPHGLHDQAVRAAARDAGFEVAYTTQFGRNGAGTDAWCLRRVPVFRADGPATFLFKVLTGEPRPQRHR